MTRFPGAGLIEAMSRIVPASRRSDWRREWEAETAYAWKRLSRGTVPAGWGARARLRLRVLNCVIDALWEGKERLTMAGLFDEVRFAWRSLMRRRSFTGVTVLTLALGIGANTAVFTLVDGVLIQPLPFPEADALVSIRHEGRDGRDQLPISDGLYQLYRERAASLEGVAMYGPAAVNVVVDGEPVRVAGQAVTPGFFSVLRQEAAMGRTFTEEEGAPGGEPVVVLSDGFWRTRFGADPGVVGRTLDVNGALREIVGVMPADFGFPDRDALLWLPMVVDPARAQLGSFNAQGIGRMAPGVTLPGVASELAGFITRLDEIFPESAAPAFLREVNLQARVASLKESVVGDVRATLWVLLGTVGFVLLIACANVANLLLVRAEGRQRELALRVAVGAGRRQIVRWFMAESVILTGLGATVGVLLAGFAVGAVLRFVPADLPRLAEVAVDLRVLAFTGVVATGCALFFGLFPLLRYGMNDLAGELREGGGRHGTAGRERHAVRNTLVVAQMALALVLLIGSGLMFRSFQALREVDPGFDPAGVLTARITIPGTEVPEGPAVEVFFRDLRDRLQGVPGVASVGFVEAVPLLDGAPYFDVEVEDHPRAPDELPIFARQNSAGPGYVEAMGLRLLEGRAFQEGDGPGGNRAVLVSRSFAQAWWPGRSALGRRVRLGIPGDDWYTIVGVVDDAAGTALDAPVEETIYWFPTLGPEEDRRFQRSLQVVIRTAGDPLQMVPVLRQEVRALNPRIPVSNPITMEAVVRSAMARTSFTMALLGSASGIALLLGLVGIYGVISYVVSQRTREIGVRIALGASRGTVQGMVVRQGLILAGAGVGVGVVAALALSTALSSLLYGVSATDPLTYLVLSAGLVVTAVLASWIPAHRAGRVDPSTALRAD
ncbi:MAG TPA: ABC transporter permease, partial [Longimicrobiales bacterium]|nr:ABC transporter permease [Longimicrobiales bacterium]